MQSFWRVSHQTRPRKIDPTGRFNLSLYQNFAGRAQSRRYTSDVWRLGLGLCVMEPKSSSGREGGRSLKTRVKTAGKRSLSSTLWLERQLKARLLKDKIVTQIVRETTLAPSDFLKSNGQPKRRVEDPATIAWKLSTGAYYKDGGRPWQLADVRPGVCYVGLAYKRRDPTGDDRFAVCAAQMFLSSGEGVVFRGALGPWYLADSEQFHLDELAARNLLKMVIDEYRGQHNEPPAELFLHAKSSFTDEEWKGFTNGAPPLTNVVGVQIADGKDNLKLFRPGKYPVIRGSALLTGDDQAFLWTAGYVPS